MKIKIRETRERIVEAGSVNDVVIDYDSKDIVLDDTYVMCTEFIEVVE